MASATNSAPTRQRVSLKKENFSAGGLLPEGDYLITEAGYVLFQYTSKEGVGGALTTALRLMLQPVTKTGNTFTPAADAEAKDQHYSVGDPQAIVPSEDGNFLEAVGSRTTLGSGSNYFMAYDALLNAGLPEDKFDEAGAGMLVGMIGHLVHIPAPDRSNMRAKSAVGTGAVATEPKKSDFPKTVPVFKTILVAPWDKGKKVTPIAAVKAPVKTVAPAAAPVQATLPLAAEAGPENRCAEFIKEAVGGNGGKMQRTRARLEVHRRYNSLKIPAEQRDAELAIFSDDAVLADALASVNCLIDGGDIELVQ